MCVCVQIAEAHKRELRLLQQEQQVSIARAKEDVRDAKNREISEIWAKSNQVGGDARVVPQSYHLVCLPAAWLLV